MTEFAQKMVLLGGGGHATVVSAAARAQGNDVLGYVGPPSLKPQTLAWLGEDEDYYAITAEYGDHVSAFPGLGCVDRPSSQLRQQVIMPFWGDLAPAVIHRHAIVAKTATIQAGSFVAAGAIISENCVIGSGCIVNTGAVVDHDSVVGNGTHIATGARIAGGVSIGEWCLIGAGATITQERQIADGTILGAGALLFEDTDAHQTYIGHPARLVSS